MSYIETEGIRLASSTLEELEDTNISNPTSSDVLHYDGNKWVNTAIGDAAYKDVSDTVTTGDTNLVTGDAVATAIDQLPDALSELDDVDITTPTDGQILVYDDTDDEWKNADIPDPSVTAEATGNPITLTDGADAPMVECKATITPKQDLHGQDKPWVGGAGKNKYSGSDISIINKSQGYQFFEYTCLPNTTYTVAFISNTDFNAKPLNSPNGVTHKFTTGQNVYTYTTGDTIATTNAFYFPGQPPADVKLTYCFISEGTINPQNYAYEPYSNICPITGMDEVEITVADAETDPTVENTYTIDLNGTRYGGTVDAVRGILTNRMGYIASYNGETIGEPWLSDRDEYVAGTTPTTGAEVVYTLSTPVEVPLSPTLIRTLSGYNYIWTDADSMDIEYITKPYEPLIEATDISIEEHGKTIESIITENLEPRMVASRNYTIGELIISGDKAYSATANIASGATLTVGTNVAATTIEDELTRILPAVTSADNGKVLGVTNGNWGVVEQSGGVDEDIIAPAYNSSETYNIADYCMYNGKMYKCNTANTTGTWDSAKWDETCVSDELTLKTAVIVAPRVDQTATYTYNGTEQTLAFEYINSNNTIVTGNKHTDAGTYTCTVSLKNPNDLWSDTMDNVDKTFTWTINKVTSSITLSPTTFYFTDDTPQTLIATVTGQPFVLSGYDTSLITITQVSNVSGVYTYSIVASGTAGTTTITASIAESTNYTAASATAAVETEEFTPGTVTIVPWSTGTDAEIQAMLDAYYADKLTWAEMGWAIGDARVIHLSAMQAPNPNSSSTWAAQDITVVIVAHDHNDLATPINGHTKACITVQTREVMNNNTSGYNQAGHIYVNGDSRYDMTFTKWSDLYMRTYMNSVVFDAFDSSFKSMIKPSLHYRHTTYNGTESEQVTDNLFLPSYPEIFGTASYTYYVATNPVEGTQFSYYSTSSNRIKYGNNNGSSNGVAQYWWEGSASSNYDSSNGYCWCRVGNGGGASNYYGTSAYGLAPAFVM